MNILFRKPLDLNTNELQVYLHDEKQESYYVTIALLTLGYIASARWPGFAAVYTAFGGMVLTAFGGLLGVNIAHKFLNNKVSGQVEEEAKVEASKVEGSAKVP